MLLLLFHVGQERYALESDRVVQVFPNLLLKEIHHAPDYIAGLFNYRGQIIPVLDLSYLIQGKVCPNLLSTRIILVKNQVNQVPEESSSPTLYLLGLRAERVTTTLDVSTNDLKEKAISIDAAPYLGKIITDDQGLIQLIHIEHLLSGVSSIALLTATE